MTKPIVFYGAALYIGCISYIAFNNNLLLGAVITASFLIIIFSTIDIKFSILIISFFVFGIACSYTYYNVSINTNIIKVRLIKYNEFYSIGEYSGKNILIKGELKKSDQGSNLTIKGKFEPIKDYSRGIVGTLYIDEVNKNKGDYISAVSNFKTQLYNKFTKLLGEEKSALVLSICFGDASYLSDEQKNDFKKLGVIHAISVSGFHMAIIYKLLEGIFGITISIVVSLLYVLFTGTQAATLRAFIMIFILKMSKKVFKNYDALSALSISAILILILKPYYCMDLGFILSYLSTLGILLYYNKVRRTLYNLPSTINESISLTLSAQVFSMPYAALTLQNISFGFIPGNIILLPIYTVLVILGNIALIFYKIDIIFNMLSKILNLFMLILDGATFLLLKITPPITYLNIFEGCALFLIIISFILVKRGFNKFKSVPIFILIFLLINNYKFFPNIEYVDLGISDGIIITYKNNRVLITNEGENIIENVKSINEKFRFTKIIKNPKEGLIFKLDNKFIVETISNINNPSGSLTLEISFNKKKTIFTRNTQNFSDIDLKKYDIIVLPQKGYYYSKIVNINNLKSIKYDVIFNKVYPSFTFNKF